MTPPGAPSALSRQIRSIVRHRSFRSVYQPILNLRTHRIEGFQCLTRFDTCPVRTPDRWFSDAEAVGLGVELEIATFKAALHGCAPLPASGFLALNVSPDALLSGRITTLLTVVDPRRIYLELTEHAPVTDYPALQGVLGPLRARGVRIAIDDVGAGYSNLQHILALRPDLLKIDVSLTENVDLCPSRATLMSGLVRFAGSLGSRVLAEGVETIGQMEALRSLGIDLVQGYLVGRPRPAEEQSLSARCSKAPGSKAFCSKEGPVSVRAPGEPGGTAAPAPRAAPQRPPAGATGSIEPPAGFG